MSSDLSSLSREEFLVICLVGSSVLNAEASGSNSRATYRFPFLFLSAIKSVEEKTQKS